MRAGLFYRLILTILIFVGCQTQSTKVRETTKNLPVPKDGDIVVTDKTVLLDARPLFQFSSGHLPQAILVRWDDFSRPGSPNKGEIDPDPFGLARRLARLGITPETPVVILGNGNAGIGEEGRVAWVLAYLGVKQVQIAREDHLDGKRMPGEGGLVKNAPIWKPSVNSTLMVTRKELLASAKKMTTPGTEPVVILDVRSPADYLKKRATTIEIGSINMEWKLFIDDRGRPRRQIMRDLQAVGIDPDERIIVLSDDGVKSAIVTMALRELGYSRAGNFPEGLNAMK
jgi:thiosulfate/3-mercaptopyruvate sulfurtransferase